ncbi:Adenylate cyclase [Salisediminibacterium beveridgei]|uniref:Adenylate cyclase n=1 Tax=Salisediminibacterium beveridgei TaxID=632773 RepID=A0A1D7QWI7_9BACI|nr:Adenylate cyclase [Salisediminibacterium beveridgei]
MSQEIEIEFKQRLDQSAFLMLKEHFEEQRTPFFRQVNHYFETEDFLLKAHQSALRVREKNNMLVLTFKQPYEKGLLETHQPLSEKAFESMKKTGDIPEGEVKEQIASLIASDSFSLIYYGSLTTERSEINLPEGQLVLDQSQYLQHTDFELEFESSSYQEGEKFFNHLIERFELDRDIPDNKIRRFFKALDKQRSDN